MFSSRICFHISLIHDWGNIKNWKEEARGKSQKGYIIRIGYKKKERSRFKSLRDYREWASGDWWVFSSSNNLSFVCLFSNGGKVKEGERERERDMGVVVIGCLFVCLIQVFE